jgi:hypothetical protein
MDEPAFVGHKGGKCSMRAQMAVRAFSRVFPSAG